MRVSEIKYLFAMTLILLLASAIGVSGLNADVIWGDELGSLVFMGAFDPPFSPSQILNTIATSGPDHVPLYYLLGAGWSQLVGWSQLALRYLSLLAGVAMIAWLYRLVCDDIDRRNAIVAAFVVTSNAYVMIFFHEVRNYAFILLLVVVHTWCYRRLVRSNSPSSLLWGCFIASAAVLLYTHFLGLFFLAALGASHLLIEGWSSRTRSMLVGWAVAVGSLLPYLPTILAGGYKWGETESAILAIELAEPLVSLLSNGLGILLIPIVLNLAYQISRRRNTMILTLISLALIYFTLLIGASRMFDLITLSRMRYFLILWFPCMILIAFSISEFSHSPKIVIILLAVWALAGLQFERSGQIRQYATHDKRIMQYPPLHFYKTSLLGKVRPEDFLVGFSESLSVNENKGRLDVGIADYYLGAQLGIDGVFLHTNLKRYRLEEDVRSILKARPLVLLAHDPSNAPLNYAGTLAVIQSVFAPCDLLADEPTLLIRRYAHAVMGCNHEAKPIEYENGIRVVDRALRLDAGGERIEALTWWDVPDEAMLDEYNISLQIISSEGKNVRQTDHHLYNNIVPWSVIDLSTEALPADDYALVLILYRRDTGSKVVGLDQSTGESGSILPLLGFTERLADSN